MDQNRPAHTLRYGALNVAVWRNRSDLGVFYSVSFSRSRKQDDTWVKSPYFGECDLCLLAKAMLDVHSWIQTQKTAEVIPLTFPGIDDEAQEATAE